MKRLVAVISGLLVLPAFAEVAPEYFYQEMMAQYAAENPEMEFVTDSATDEVADVPEQSAETQPVVPVVPTAVSPRNTSGRAAASRAVASSTTTSARNVANRATAATTARTVSARPAVVNTKTTSSRAAVTTPSRAAASRTARSASNTVANRPTTTVRSTTASVPGVTTRAASAQKNNSNTARASIVQTDTVNTPLYISGDTTARVSTRSTNVSARVPTIRVGSTTSTGTSETSTSSTISMDELAQLTDYCKAQYVACMDNFCNVLDDNQGRCSCSANLDNYAETEAALKQATEDLQEVAQQIQYIGLTAEEVETLFTQTEAELQMQSSTDNSQLKNDLDKIKSLIVDVESGRASSSSSGGLSFDLSGLLDFTIDSTGFDLGSLLGMSTTDTSSISNQRGEKLYDTAAARCRASVLNSCQAQGVDITVITNAYDLEIDKACIAYERALTESNDQMASTVRNAKSVLQRARLLVAQQKNQYDLRGCVTELDNCMQDDFVCGDDYENCLDPSGKFIVNGEIVVGSEPGAPGDALAAIYDAWEYGDSGARKNAWGLSSSDTDDKVSAGTLAEYIAETVTSSVPSGTSTDMSAFLQNKIGYHDDGDGKNYGMCIAVLNRCQDLTYEGTGQNKKYIPNNNVIKEYLNRTLVQIKSAQDTILADYAEDCITDVASCLTQNNYDPDDNTVSASAVDFDTIKVDIKNASSGITQQSVVPTAAVTIKNPDDLSDKLQQCTSGNCTWYIGGRPVSVDEVQALLAKSVTISNGNKLAIRACNPVITTCMSVNGVSGDLPGIELTAEQWIISLMDN